MGGVIYVFQVARDRNKFMFDTGEIRKKSEGSDQGPRDCMGTAWPFRAQHSSCGLMAVLVTQWQQLY